MVGPSHPNSRAMTLAMTGTGEEVEIERRDSALNGLRRVPRTLYGRSAPNLVVAVSDCNLGKRTFRQSTYVVGFESLNSVCCAYFIRRIFRSEWQPA
jgi:hypothetical protein